VNVNPSLPHRKNLRLPEFDYSQNGSYFVTIVTHDRKHLFGEVVKGEVVLDEVGRMVEGVWASIPAHFPQVELGEFVIMPNHIHGIISITVGARHAVPLQPNPFEEFGQPVPGSLPTIIRSFKSASSRMFHQFPNYAGDHLWQRNYYEHIIRNERDHLAIYDYILANPMNWEKDEENPHLLR